MSEKKDKDKCSGCNGESCCSSCSDDTNVGNTCRTYTHMFAPGWDPNQVVTAMYAISEAPPDDKRPDYNYDIDKALKMAAEKYFKWHVVLGKHEMKSFDTVEEAENYLNSLDDDICEIPCIIIFGQQHRRVNKFAIEPSEK